MNSLYRPGAQLDGRGVVKIHNLGWEATTVQDESQEAEMKQRKMPGQRISRDEFH